MKKNFRSKFALVVVLAFCISLIRVDVKASVFDDLLDSTEYVSNNDVEETDASMVVEDNIDSDVLNETAEIKDTEQTADVNLVGKAAGITLSGTSHIQGIGDKAGTWNPSTGILTLGTTGQGRRLEAVTINMQNNTGYEGELMYRVHRQTYGWSDYVKQGVQAGTTGEGKRLEGIQISLSGELAKYYDVKYRVHIQTYGWNQGWQRNCALAGTEGEAKRLECLEIQIVPKTEEMGVEYRVHRQTYGWENRYKTNGEVSGTVGEGKRLEGIELALTGNQYDGYIRYKTYVQSYGWLDDWGVDGTMAGTVGQAKRLEAITIEMGGEVSSYYDIYYRVHAQSYGWLGWTKNGGFAGTLGLAKRLEAIQIVLVPKGLPAPAASYKGATQKISDSFITPKSTTDLVKYVDKYGYKFGKGVKAVVFTTSDGSELELVINPEGTGMYSYGYWGKDYSFIMTKKNNNYSASVSLDDFYGPTFYSYDNLFKNDTGYELNTISFRHFGNSDDVDDDLLNSYVKDGVDNINRILEDKFGCQILR